MEMFVFCRMLWQWYRALIVNTQTHMQTLRCTKCFSQCTDLRPPGQPPGKASGITWNKHQLRQVSGERYKNSPPLGGATALRHTPARPCSSLTWTKHAPNMHPPKRDHTRWCLSIQCLWGFTRQKGQRSALAVRRSSERSFPLEDHAWPMRYFSTTWVCPSAMGINKMMSVNMPWP